MSGAPADIGAAAAALLGLGGTTAIVTGGNRGIGRAIAGQLAELGARVVIACRREDSAQGAIADIAARGGEARWAAFEAADPDSPRALVAGILAGGAQIDLLVNNAGIFPASRFDTATAAEWDEVFAINTRSAFLLLRECAEAMRAAGTGGAIVNISSMGAIKPAAPARFAYNASKAAMNRLTEDAARHYGRHGIRVNAVLPGPVASGEGPQSEAHVAMMEAIRKKIPLGRIGATRDIAAAVAFLASPAGAFVTGHLLVADGGFTLG